MKVLALTIKPNLSPDTRYRIYQYIDFFKKQEIYVDHLSLLNERFFLWHQEQGNTLLKILFYMFFLFKRIIQVLILVPKYDVIWILRELSPIGPPWLEKLVFGLHSKVILDIDDAIFLKDKASSSFIHRYLRDFTKFEDIAKRFSTVVCGNRFLADYFNKLGAKVEVIPTVVSYEKYSKIKRNPSSHVRIGWIGTPTNRVHFQVVKDVFHKLIKEVNFELIIIGLNKPLDWNLENITYLPWELSKELDYFSLFDIGIMPLLDFEFAKGKCAFKIIQYMAAGIPVIASPIGANVEVIQDGLNGFLAKDDREWILKMKRLICDQELREKMGSHGRKTVKNFYSLEKQGRRYVHIFRKIN
ncbi:glycosyltransferase family 4 protein [Desulfothermus naphthae]